MAEIENKVHLSPAEAEIGAELGNSNVFKNYNCCNVCLKANIIHFQILFSKRAV